MNNVFLSRFRRGQAAEHLLEEMPDRKSKNSEEHKPINCLRRSPRLHCENQINAQIPKTPKPAETRCGRPCSFSTPLTKIKKTSHAASQNGGGKETQSNSEKFRNGCRSARTPRRVGLSGPGSEKQYAKEKPQTRSSISGCRSVKVSEKPVKGSRRSGRRDRGGNVGKTDEVVIEKRVTRSSFRRNKVVINEISESDSEDYFGESVVNLSKKPKKNVGEIEKRVTRSSRKICTKKQASNVSNTSRRKAIISDEAEAKGDDEVSKVHTSKKDVKDCGVVRRNGEQDCGRKKQIGEKRKRDGAAEECETAQGWSKEQEFGLQRAYFTAKPTPQFWKKVSRMVMFDSCFLIHMFLPFEFCRMNPLIATFGLGAFDPF